MAPVASYPDIVKQVIREHASHRPLGDIQVEAIFDDALGHYELMYAGWTGKHRVHGSVIHVDVRDGKVWVQSDGTEGGVALQFVEAGIPREHIVLAFQHPALRCDTDFATS
jgi:ketopantoate reductase